MKKRIFIALVVCAAFLLTAWAEKPPKDALWKLRKMGRNQNSLIAMTRNMYFGTDVDYVMAGPTEEVPMRVAQAVQWFYSTNISERVKAFADEIARGKPHLVGLQEVAIVRFFDSAYNPVEEYDFLALLESALADRNLNYDVVGSVEDVNIFIPMLVGSDPYGAYVQLIDHDVVLARHDVKILESEGKNFDAKLPVPSLGIEIPRGYVSIKAKVGRKIYRFINTHLEPILKFEYNGMMIEDPSVQLAQANELIIALQNETLPVIIVGDLNSPATDGETYQLFKANGYVDTWTRNRVRPRIPGYTNPHPYDLRSTDVQLDQRIDLILVKSQIGICGYHFIGPVWAYVVGDELDDRILNPDDNTLLWPSDHAGVIALLRIPYIPKFH